MVKHLKVWVSDQIFVYNYLKISWLGLSLNFINILLTNK